MELASFGEIVGGFVVMAIGYGIFKLIRAGFYGYFYLRPLEEELSSLKMNLERNDKNLKSNLKNIGLKYEYSAYGNVKIEDIDFRKKHLLALSQFITLPSYGTRDEIEQMIKKVEENYQLTMRACTYVDDLNQRIYKVRNRYNI